MDKSLRKAVIAGNWKMNKTPDEAKAIISEMKPLVAGADCKVVLCVPFIDIPDVEETTTFAYEILDLYDKGIAVGDESMSFHPDDNIKRSEAAAIISRILFYDMRIELAKG